MSQVAPLTEKENVAQIESLTAHFSAPHAELAAALNVAEFGVPVAPNPDAQKGVIVETGRDNQLTLSTFDFETAVVVTLAVGTSLAGRSLLDFDEFKKAVAAVAAGETKAVAARIPVSLAGDLLSTPDMAVPISTHPVREFVLPPEPVPAMATVDARTLLAQLDRVLPCAGREDALPVLTGVQMTLHGETLAMSATDRFRIAVAEVPAQATAQRPEGALSTLVPGGTLRLLSKRLKSFDGRVGIGIIESSPGTVARATLVFGTTTITMRPLEGRLPAYMTLIPTEAETSLSADRDVLVRAVRKAAAFLKAKRLSGCPVSLSWDTDGCLTVAPRIGEPADQQRVRGMGIPATIQHGDLTVLHGSVLTFNPAYLLVGLDAFTGDTVTLHLPPVQDGQVIKPVLLTAGATITGDGYRHLLMPVRLDALKK